MENLGLKQISIDDESAQGDPRDTGIRILWTGGWDSTFRVLYAALVDGKRVEPHYIIDTGRPSSLHELRAISRVRDLLRISNKPAYDRISNLQITSGNEIPEDMEISNSWKRLRCRMDLARQYDWLARYAKSKNLTDLELCVERGGGMYTFLKERVERTRFGTYRLKRGAAVGEGDEVFARFEFPILDYTKAQMRDLAKENGFLKILERSWFCHEPINGRPCGMCSPCVLAVEEGVGYRLPKTALFRHYLVQFVRKSPLSNVKLVRQVYHFMRYNPNH
jgi:7-cyano-7-deazaguanine synthase in queuosine biosynthesis